MAVSIWERAAALERGAGCPLPYTTAPIPVPAPKRRLRVLTFNVWGLPRPLLHRPSRMAEISARAPGFDADLVAFQEVFSRRAYGLAYLKSYPYRAWGEMKIGASIMQGSGLLLLSRWPILETSTLRFTCASGTDSLSRKGALHARVLVPELGEVDVFNTHLNAGLGAAKERVRERQMKELAAFMSARSGRGPLVLLGDFNSEPGSPSYSVLCRALPMRDGHDEYQRLVLPSSGRNLPKEAFDGFTLDPRRNTISRAIEPLGKPMRIDHVWFRDGERRELRLRDSRLVFDLPSPKGFLSDHFGVLADLLF